MNFRKVINSKIIIWFKFWWIITCRAIAFIIFVRRAGLDSQPAHTLLIEYQNRVEIRVSIYKASVVEWVCHSSDIWNLLFFEDVGSTPNRIRTSNPFLLLLTTHLHQMIAHLVIARSVFNESVLFNIEHAVKYIEFPFIIKRMKSLSFFSSIIVRQIIHVFFSLFNRSRKSRKESRKVNAISYKNVDE